MSLSNVGPFGNKCDFSREKWYKSQNMRKLSDLCHLYHIPRWNTLVWSRPIGTWNNAYYCIIIPQSNEQKWTAFRDFFKWLKSMFFLYHTSRRSMFFSRSTPKPCCWGAHLAWGRKINWSQIVWSRKWYKIKNCSFCIISLSRMHYFKNWSLILKGNEALQPTNHLWAQFFPWQVHNSQKCIFVIFWHSHLVVVSGDHVQCH